MTVRDLIFKAGNVLESAYLDEAEITSVSVVNGRLGDLSHRKVNLKKRWKATRAQCDAAAQRPAACQTDCRLSQCAVYHVIRPDGFPGKYPFRKGERLSDIVERAGGFTPHAYLRGAQFTRVRVKELQQQGLKEMADRMERELLSGGAEQFATAVSKEEIAAKQGELEQKKKFVDTLRKTRPPAA
jgi:hypothetical protein